MPKRFLYASTISYGKHVYESLFYDSCSEIFALTVMVQKRKNSILSKTPLRKLYSKMCRNEFASSNVNQHFSLGVWQFYLPIRNRIFRSPASEFELNFLSNRYTRKLNKILPLVDVALVASDFALDKIKIPVTTKVYLECRSVHKGINLVRPKIELECPYGVSDEGPGKWETQFESRKSDFEGLVTYSSISAASFSSVGVPLEDILIAPLPVSRVVLNAVITREPLSLLWVGRGYPSKGLDIAVEVARLLKVNLTVVGALHSNLVVWLRNFPNVNYLGRLDKSQVFEQMLRNEILIVPTVESYGLAVYEALENGMKVVTSPYVGINEWLNPHPNLFVCEEFKLNNFVGMAEKALASKASEVITHGIPVFETWRQVLSRI